MRTQSAYQRVVETTRTEYTGGPRMPRRENYEADDCRYAHVFVTTVAQTWLIGRVFQADARNCRRVNFEAMSLDEPLKRDSDHGEARTLAELIPDETNLEAELIWRSDVERAHRLLDRLDPRTADVLRRRFSDEPDRLQDIADDLGCTKEWVRQIEERGLKQLRNMFGK